MVPDWLDSAVRPLRRLPVLSCFGQRKTANPFPSIIPISDPAPPPRTGLMVSPRRLPDLPGRMGIFAKTRQDFRTHK